MQYHIVFSADKNYIPFLFVATQSILNHLDETKTNDEMVFHVLVDDSVDMAQAESLAESFIKRTQNAIVSCAFEFHAVDTSIFTNFTPWREKENQEARSPYYRILLSQYIKEDVNRALYLDLDILIKTDIRELFTLNMEDKLVAVAPDIRRQNLKEKERTLPAKENPQDKLSLDLGAYFNTGIMLVNLELWRRLNATEACIDMAQKYRTTLHAQDLLNYIAQGQFLSLEPSWNFTITLASKKVKKNETPLEPKIVHFTPHKPWRQNDYFYPLPDALKGYADEWTAIGQEVIEVKDLLPHPNEKEEDVPLFSFKVETTKQKLMWIAIGVALFIVNIGTVFMLFKH